ncbi:MAG: hypothetical protein R8G66_06930 [Cytophagales bacterium]|nr:hypothetical protein [Cytophagales bacterium]
MQYKTHVFEEKDKKDRSYQSHYWMVFIFLTLNVIGFIYFGAGIGVIGTIGMVVYLVNAAQEEKKKMGLKAYGKRKGELTVAEDYLIVENRKIVFDQVSNLTIYVDEFTGMTKDFFWSYHGGNNEICFEHKGKHYSFNYIIRNKLDFLHVEKLVTTIEAKYPPNV